MLRRGVPMAARPTLCSAAVVATHRTQKMLRHSRHCSSTIPSLLTGAPTAHCRWCSTTAGTPVSSSSPLQQQQQSPRRRSKRFNYADADRVYAANESSACPGLKTGELRSASVALPPPPASPFARQAPTKSQQLVGVFRRVGTRLEQQRQMALLALLRTPYVGALVVLLLEASAYTAYIKGSVMLFTRKSVTPSIAECGAGVYTRDQSPSDAPTHRRTLPADRLSSSSASSRVSLISANALDCLYVGHSPIHSRGLFSSRPLPRGTRVIAEPHRSLLLGPHFLKLLADTHDKLPDTWHYTQPTGSVVELVTQAQPHHLMNHSCRPNVCSGLSRVFWGAASLAADHQGRPRPHTAGGTSAASPAAGGSSGAAPLWERLTRWPLFDDANSFFVTRDIAAGEELTLDYSTRVAPFYAGKPRHSVQEQGWLLCRCGEPCCRHYVYRHAPEVAAYLHRLRTHRLGQQEPVCSAGRCELDTLDGFRRDPLHIAAKLLALGVDDELVLLSYAARPTDIVAYLYSQPLPSFGSTGPLQDCIDVERRRVSKRELLLSYRHVFRLLNEAVPQTPCHANDEPGEGARLS